MLAVQHGVISRRQVLAAGGTDNDLQRLVRRREWRRLHEGVFVDHTGPVSWDQRAWAAVLVHGPAALTGASALRAHGVRGHDGPDLASISLVVAEGRRVAPAAGVCVRRSSSFDRDVQAHLSPPRVRLECAVLQVAAEARTEDRAVAVLADACQSGRTTPDRLLAALEQTPRIRHRALLVRVLTDVATGACSALERRYLVRVERAHGLPTGARQRRVLLGSRPGYRDVEYVGLRTVAELDGRLGHSAARDRWADLERDLASAVRGDLTLRIGWLQVLEAHRLADSVGSILVARGWEGQPRPCGPDCVVPDIGGSPAPDAGDPPMSWSA